MMSTAAKLEEVFVPDDVLAEHASVGSTAAFAELVERHSDAAYTIATNVCTTERSAAEAVQEAFLTAWRDLRSFPAGARFSTWLYRIAANTALAHCARDRHPRTSPPLDTFLPAFDAEGMLIASDGRWPELEGRSSQRTDITARLRDALGCIDARSRTAFVLCDLLQLRAEEGAVILGLPPRTVRRMAHQSRLLMRGFIDRL